MAEPGEEDRPARTRQPAPRDRVSARHAANIARMSTRANPRPERSQLRRTFAPRAVAVMIARDDGPHRPPARPPGRAHPRPGRGDGDLPPGPRPRPGGLRRRGL